jgi:hypothetical protein
MITLVNSGNWEVLWVNVRSYVMHGLCNGSDAGNCASLSPVTFHQQITTWIWSTRRRCFLDFT